jgi:hypothetical protein
MDIFVSARAAVQEEAGRRWESRAGMVLDTEMTGPGGDAVEAAPLST